MAKKSKKNQEVEVPVESVEVESVEVESVELEEVESDEVESESTDPVEDEDEESEDEDEESEDEDEDEESEKATVKLKKFVVRKGYAYYPKGSSKGVAAGKTVELADITVGDQKWKLEEVK